MADALERVGPVLEAGEVAEAIVLAIRAHATDVQVQDRGAYLRVLVPSRCHVTRAAIEQELGREFRLPGDLERVMPSFKGTFRVDEEEATWLLVRR
jgi:toluene monooxygenase system protein D